MIQQLQPWTLLAGRILLSMIFILSGTMKIFKWSETAGHMTSEGMIAVPFFLTMAILFEVGGGLSVLLGCGTRWGALALALFLIPVTLIFHDFWTYEGLEMQNQMQHFMKNWTILGGLLVLVAAGGGRLSVDRWLDPGAARDNAR
jgi:putative oxidoreductase